MKSEQRAEFLAREWSTLLQIYEGYESRFLTIKSWSATLGLGGMGIAFQTSAPELFLVASAASIVFWLIDTTMDMYQMSYGPRIETLEAYFADPENQEEPAPLQSYTDFWYHYNQGTWLRSLYEHGFSMPAVLPHSVVVLAGIVLYLLNLCFGFLR